MATIVLRQKDLEEAVMRYLAAEFDADYEQLEASFEAFVSGLVYVTTDKLSSSQTIPPIKKSKTVLLDLNSEAQDLDMVVTVKWNGDATGQCKVCGGACYSTYVKIDNDYICEHCLPFDIRNGSQKT